MRWGMTSAAVTALGKAPFRRLPEVGFPTDTAELTRPPGRSESSDVGGELGDNSERVLSPSLCCVLLRYVLVTSARHCHSDLCLHHPSYMSIWSLSSVKTPLTRYEATVRGACKNKRNARVYTFNVKLTKTRKYCPKASAL